MILQLILIVVVISTIVVWTGKGKDRKEDRESTSTQRPKTESHHTGKGSEDAPSQAESITFDPNTADSATLVRVGLTPWQAQNIIKYRQKGWQCHRPEDFKRIYGLTVGQWEHLRPLIKIGREYQYLADNEDVYQQPELPRHTRQGTGEQKDESPMRSAHNRVDKLHEGETIDLATADTATLQRIPGIGSFYSNKIIEYGKKLGGFYSTKQLNDKALDFLPLDIERYITLSKPEIKPLRINTCTIKQLSNHPYITYPQAKQIADRIRLYGPIRSWDEILFLSEFSSKDKERLEPYISFE